MLFSGTKAYKVMQWCLLFPKKFEVWWSKCWSVDLIASFCALAMMFDLVCVSPLKNKHKKQFYWLWNLHCTLQSHLSSLHHWNPPKKTKIKNNKNKKVSHCGSCSGCITVCPTLYTFIKTVLLKIFIAMTHWSGFKPLASATLSILDSHLTPLRYPVVGLCLGDSAALVMQDLTLHISQQFINGVDVGMTNIKPWIWAWLVVKLVRPPTLLYLCHQGQLSHLAQMRGGYSSLACSNWQGAAAALQNATACEGQDQLLCTTKERVKTSSASTPL